MKKLLCSTALLALLVLPTASQAGNGNQPQAFPGQGAEFTIRLECTHIAGGVGTAEATIGATFKDTQIESYIAWGESLVASPDWETCRVYRTNPGGQMKMMWNG